MSCAVNLLALPTAVFDSVFTEENIRGRRSDMNPFTSLSFPRSRAALWDGSPVGEKLFLQLLSNRNLRLVLLEKALRLAQRHVRRSDKPSVQCFFLGSVLVDSDEEGVTVTLDRFDPGRDQPNSSGRVPCAMLPGDVLVPCLYLTHGDTSDAVQSESDLHHCFKSLQQLLSGRQNLELGQLLKVRGRIICSQQSDATLFSLSWSSVCPSVGLDVQAVRAVPIIPTALLRSLTSTARPLPQLANCQKGYLTMDQTRKLLLLLESDPKACSLPLVGLWLSGVTHVSSPHVWVWCLQFLFNSALQDRVFSDGDYFLLVLFCSTHKSPQFYKCGRSRLGPGPRLDYKLLTASQCVTLYQVGAVEGQAVHCELSSEGDSRQMDVFRMAQLSFNSSHAAAGVCASDQDSGVEDEDVSPRPSPSPHLPTQQVRRVQPSVPELSLLVDNSFNSIQTGCTAPPPPADWKSTFSARMASCSALPQSPSHPLPHHSTPNSNLQQPCSCCTSHSCTSIRCSPRFLPGVADESSQKTPLPLSSQQKTPLPLSSQQKTPLPLSSQQKTPPPLSSQQKTPLPLSSQQKTPLPLSSQQKTPPPLSSQQKTPLPLSSQQKTPLPPPSSSHQDTYLASCHHHVAPSLPSSNILNISSSTLSAFPPTLPKYPPSPSTPPASHSTPPHPSSHPGDPPYHLTSHPADPALPPWIMHPPPVNRCWDQTGALDTYQLLLQQDRQLRLLQSQVQMLLEAQGKFQPSTESVRSTASIAVGTGASLFWADPVQPVSAPEAPAPPSSEATPLVSSPTGTQSAPSDAELSVIRPVDGAEDGIAKGQEVDASHCSSIQSPVLGESVSMYGPSDDNLIFYKELMTQVTSRLQAADTSEGGEEEEDSKQRSPSVSPDRSQFSQSPRRKQQPRGDPVVSATLQELRRLGVNVDDEDLTECDRKVQQTVESSSTLASINPAAVVSRLSVSEHSFSSLVPCASVDLSLEANAIALRYLSDSQLSRLSLGGHAPHKGRGSSGDSLLSPTNMSVATRKYMRKYGLIEEELGADEAEISERSTRNPLREAQSAELLPQSRLIKKLRPKMQRLTEGADHDAQDKENCSSRRPSLPRAEGSVGNILDLSRLRQLPKLF
ncbi:SCL-interrupting locus protein homolog [Takifugu rubripes]|uniref:SCL-interrupting locus protein n=1 Tax=Takifugu rubripes TaxID=31033 RepID=H2TP61_TAKRU|nr:SCL-interrupting locus protein [Takifugu rubripes]